MLSFASRVRKTLPIPHDPPFTVTIQKLPGRHFQAAKDAHQAQFMARMRAQFGDHWKQEIENFKSDDDQKATQQADKDPLSGFDVAVLVTHGVKAWDFVDEQGTPIPITDETLNDLGHDTEQFFAREVLRLSAPSLFDSEKGDERKNDSASSGAA